MVWLNEISCSSCEKTEQRTEKKNGIRQIEIVFKYALKSGYPINSAVAEHAIKTVFTTSIGRTSRSCKFVKVRTSIVYCNLDSSLKCRIQECYYCFYKLNCYNIMTNKQ